MSTIVTKEVGEWIRDSRGLASRVAYRGYIQQLRADQAKEKLAADETENPEGISVKPREGSLLTVGDLAL